MRSLQPRLSRGTSIIAALILAGIIGSIALGIDALKGTTVNTDALSAAADASAVNPPAQQAGAEKTECLAGHMYTITSKGEVLDDDLLNCSDSANAHEEKVITVYGKDYTISCDPKVGLESVDSEPHCAASCTEGNSVNSSGSCTLPKNVLSTPGTSGSNTLPNVSPDSPITMPPSGEAAPFFSGTICPSGKQPSVDANGNVSCSTPSNALPSNPDANNNSAAPSCSASYVGEFLANTGSYPPGCSPPSTGPQECNPACSAGKVCDQNSGQCVDSPLNGSVPIPRPATLCIDQNGNPATCPEGVPPRTSVTCASDGTCVKTPVLAPCTSNCTGTPDARNNGNNTFGNGSSPLGSILSGLARGLAQGLAPTPCTSSSYGAPITPYNSPYSPYGYSPYGPATPYGYTPSGGYYTSYAPVGYAAPGGSPCGGQPQQQAPYGVGNNGMACPQPPAQPDPSQCTVGTWRQTSATGNGCPTGYQCVPNGNAMGVPTAQLSCQPQIADPGMSLALSYSCSNSIGSTGSGFSTNNQTSGSATVTVQKPPAGTNTATYRLTCTNQAGQTASAQCSVQVGLPSITLVANPKVVASGQTSTIGWVTSGVQSCVVSSPSDALFTAANASNLSASGVAQTDPITKKTEFDLVCTTLGGLTKSASTTVAVGGAAPAQDISVSSSADGAAVSHGNSVAIRWQTANAQSNTAISLWLIDLKTENTAGLIAGALPPSGSYQWVIPPSGASCNQNSPAVCASDLVAGQSYGIEAALYSPTNAFLGGTPAPSDAVTPTYTDSGYTPQPFSIGE